MIRIILSSRSGQVYLNVSSKILGSKDDEFQQSFLESFGAGSSNRHFAMSHDDTTEGAVHCFEDEHGKECQLSEIHQSSLIAAI